MALHITSNQGEREGEGEGSRAIVIALSGVAVEVVQAMGDDIQLQAAIYASLRSQSAASSGGSGGGGRSLGSFGGHGHLRSGPRHTGPAWGSNARASSGGHGAPKGKHRVRSSALKKEGILPAKKQR